MRRFIVTLVLIVTLLLNPAAAQGQSGDIYKGVSLVFHGHDATDGAAILRLLDILDAMHVNSLLITFPVYMDSWNASEIKAHFENAPPLHPHSDSPTREELQAIIVPALERGMTVFLRPLLDEGIITETGPDDAWRGTIQPPADALDVFYASYHQMLEYYAQTPGITWLVIGTEMNSLEVPKHEAYWKWMISSLKSSPATGNLLLTYAQNWDTGGYQGYPTWFSSLDAVSIDAYFPLEGLGNSATAAQIAEGMDQWRENLELLKAQSPHRKLFITEAGISSQLIEPSVLGRPWAHVDDASQVGLELQANYTQGVCAWYRTALDSSGSSLVDGIFWWSTVLGAVSPTAQPLQDRGFEFVGKPAQQELARCYQP
jgi:hypothetical protein